MSVANVLRKDFKDVRRARLIWAPAVLYTLFMLLFFWGQTQGPDPQFSLLIQSLAGMGGALLIPLIALVAAYLSIAGERESGSIKFLLGLPNSRSDVVLGKVLSRAAVVAAGLLLAFAVGVVAAAVLVPDMAFEYGDYAIFIGLTVLYAVTYVAIAVSISAVTASRSRAMGGAIGFFFVFNLVWNFLPVNPRNMVQFLADQVGTDVSQNALDLIWASSPTGAYFGSLQLLSTGQFSSGGADPFYLEGWFMVLILLAWLVVPLAIGTWRFQRAELG
ncbi:ABC transporter permease [Halostella sp. JP-L12]|uniref:ABC transporter permease n=1 Tax=Halostella TaxID=1843185 RepID=UPI000EF80AF4|nr:MULTISPECIES: ABC transporter permease [Halostella]NHN47643.1 ABC transporter permease [Halostella sp. JP-L12]